MATSRRIIVLSQDTGSVSSPIEKRLMVFVMEIAMKVAHMNVARLRHPPGDPRVAGFIDNVQKVNSIAERSSGYVWRFSDEALSVGEGVAFQGLADDPKLAISLSVWESVEHLWQFVNKTVHGGFLRSRDRWFEPYGGPNYVIWNHLSDAPPDISEGWDRLNMLAEKGATPQAFDFAFAGMKRDS